MEKLQINYFFTLGTTLKMKFGKSGFPVQVGWRFILLIDKLKHDYQIGCRMRMRSVKLIEYRSRLVGCSPFFLMSHLFGSYLIVHCIKEWPHFLRQAIKNSDETLLADVPDDELPPPEPVD